MKGIVTNCALVSRLSRAADKSESVVIILRGSGMIFRGEVLELRGVSPRMTVSLLEADRAYANEPTLILVDEIATLRRY